MAAQALAARLWTADERSITTGYAGAVVDFHLLIFGALFVGIVLLRPGGPVEVGTRLRNIRVRPPGRPR